MTWERNTDRVKRVDSPSFFSHWNGGLFVAPFHGDLSIPPFQCSNAPDICICVFHSCAAHCSVALRSHLSGAFPSDGASCCHPFRGSDLEGSDDSIYFLKRPLENRMRFPIILNKIAHDMDIFIGTAWWQSGFAFRGKNGMKVSSGRALNYALNLTLRTWVCKQKSRLPKMIPRVGWCLNDGGAQCVQLLSDVKPHYFCCIAKNLLDTLASIFKI